MNQRNRQEWTRHSAILKKLISAADKRVRLEKVEQRFDQLLDDRLPEGADDKVIALQVCNGSGGNICSIVGRGVLRVR